VELSAGQCAHLACVWEASACKAGNVHRGRDFADLAFTDLLASAAAVAPVLDRAAGRSVGQTVLDAITATRALVSINTNLGIVLLLSPLAAVSRSQSLRQGIGSILAALDSSDAGRVFAAIRLARPGGLGKVSAQDVADDPTLPLQQVMALAADRDLVARQYANDFQDVFEVGVPALLEGLGRFGNLEQSIVFTQLTFLSRYRDSLILRKRGGEEADQAQAMAQGVLQAGWPKKDTGRTAFAAFDSWLTALGNKRNPGTSADLVAACLFSALREKQIQLPMTFYGGDGFQLAGTFRG